MGKAITKKTPQWPVVEIFGPTIQGEGVDQGALAHFVRFGGCDFRCDWCDTPYAVLPEEVRKNATKMTAEQIVGKLAGLNVQLAKAAPWVVLTGGNPALHDLTDLVYLLQRCGYLVAVETQGSRWRDWMADVDRLCLSPKPPSANQDYDFTVIQRFLDEGLRARATGQRAYEWLFIKIPIFTEEDLKWAANVRWQLSDALLYLSAGNDAGRTVAHPQRRDTRGHIHIQRDLLDQARWLVEEVRYHEPLCASDVIVQAQFHVLLWGNEPGR